MNSCEVKHFLVSRRGWHFLCQCGSSLFQKKKWIILRFLYSEFKNTDLFYLFNGFKLASEVAKNYFQTEVGSKCCYLSVNNRWLKKGNSGITELQESVEKLDGVFVLGLHGKVGFGNRGATGVASMRIC